MRWAFSVYILEIEGVALLEHGKQWVRDLFNGKGVGFVPFLPFVGAFAAQLVDAEPEDLYQRPALMIRALQSAQALYGYDAIVGPFDTSAVAEACGCIVEWGLDGLSTVVAPPPGTTSGRPKIMPEGVAARARLPVILETMGGLRKLVGNTLPVFGVLPGPQTLAAQMTGGARVQEQDQGLSQWVGEVLVALIRAFCERGRTEGIVLAEEERLGADYSASWGPAYRTLLNVTRFYEIPLLLALRERPGGATDTLANLGAHLIMTMDAAEGVGLRMVEKGLATGLAIPCELLCRGSPDEIGAFVRAAVEKATAGCHFLTTEWSIPVGTPADNLHKVMDVLRGN